MILVRTTNKTTSTSYHISAPPTTTQYHPPLTCELGPMSTCTLLTCDVNYKPKLMKAEEFRTLYTPENKASDTEKGPFKYYIRKQNAFPNL